MRFEWNENKQSANIKKHGIKFVDAALVFEDPHYTVNSSRSGENRWLTVGKVENRTIAVIWTQRGENIRIISARKARDAEKRKYCALFPERN